MKKINKLIKDAKQLLGDMVKTFFSGNEDGFLEALGVDPEKYKHAAPDGTIGYDFMAALNDTVAESWNEYVEAYSDETSEMETNMAESSQNDSEISIDWSDDPRKHHSWNVLSSEEKEVALRQYAESNGLEVDKLPEIEATAETKVKPKNKKLFGWG